MLGNWSFNQIYKRFIMTQKFKILFLLFSLLVIANGQNTNQVIIGSNNNTIEIAVKNTGQSVAKDILITFSKLPEWFVFQQDDYLFGDVKAGDSKILKFTFDVDYTAPIDTTFNLEYLITTTNGESWSKKIPLYVTVPKEYSLSQNFPNPFNPITNISYELPLTADVELSIFNIMGQEVTNLINTEQPAGIHNVIWNAGSYASGTYFYILNAKDKFGEHSIKKKMTVIK